MKALVFDTGPIITLALNNMLWLLKKLKDKFNGEFYITESVYREAIERPMSSRRFKFEALQILKLKQEGVIKVYKNPKLRNSTVKLLKLSNSLFKAHGQYIKNLQYAEIETIVAAQLLGANIVVIDEFYTRMLLENPSFVKERMEKKLHEKVEIDSQNLEIFKRSVNDVKVIRSVELAVIAYENGFFKDFYLNISEPMKTLFEGILWAVKLNGCSMTENEINELIKIEEL
ncbi:MAG: hypothetical protein ABIJ34_07035 [archaeon]